MDAATFETAVVPHCQTCDLCGALVADWPKTPDDEWSTDKPNRDRHAAWHAALGA